jgi:hypothetical protein
MPGIAEKRRDALVERLDEDGTLREGHDPEMMNMDCWREDVIESAFEKACSMVTQASMDYAEEHGEMNESMHPMDVVDDENVKNVYATSEEWQIPVFVVQLEESPAYISPTLTEVAEVYARKYPGRCQDTTYVQVQVR